MPGSGKTYLSLEHLRDAIRSTGWPAILVDSIGDEHLDGMPHARSVREALEWTFGAGQNSAFRPDSVEEVDALVRACMEPGRVNLWVDEAPFWLSSRKGTGGPLVKLMRTHRHARANVFLTAQHLTGDVPQEALSCAPELYVFRCTAPAVLQRLEREGLDVERIRNLQPREFVRHYEGF